VQALAARYAASAVVVISVVTTVSNGNYKHSKLSTKNKIVHTTTLHSIINVLLLSRYILSTSTYLSSFWQLLYDLAVSSLYNVTLLKENFIAILLFRK